MQPYQKAVCQHLHTKKISHGTHSLITFHDPKADAWSKCYKLAVSKDIFIHYNLYLNALTCSLLVWLINNLEFEIYLYFLAYFVVK